MGGIYFLLLQSIQRPKGKCYNAMLADVVVFVDYLLVGLLCGGQRRGLQELWGQWDFSEHHLFCFFIRNRDGSSASHNQPRGPSGSLCAGWTSVWCRVSPQRLPKTISSPPTVSHS